MRLEIKRGQQEIGQPHFTRGPVYIGRQIGSQVFLPDRAVSRQHAVIQNSKDGWTIEDLDSANKTFVNETAIHKADLKHGDLIKVADFVISVNLDDKETAEELAISMGDTIARGAQGPQQKIVRKLEGNDAQTIRMPAKRVFDYGKLIEAISGCDSAQKLVHELNDLLLRQCTAFHVWTGIRFDAEGALQLQMGKKRTTERLEFNDIKLKDSITQAIEKHEFTLVPRMSWGPDPEQIRSAMIVPIIFSNSCYGAIYLANRMEHEHYTISDMDYLILAAMHVGAMLSRFKPNPLQ